MRVIGIDIGVRNLAFCELGSDGEIRDWKLIYLNLFQLRLCCALRLQKFWLCLHLLSF